MEDHNSQFREIFDKSPIGILFYDKEGITVNANNSALQMVGILNLEDILGHNLFDNYYINERKDELIKEGIVRFQAPLNLDKIKDFGLHSQKKGIIFLDYTVSVADSGFIVQIQDVTEQKKAEKALVESEKKFRSLIEVLPVGISILDKDRKILHNNPALGKILKLSREDLNKGKYVKRKYIRSDMSEMSFNELPTVKAFKEQKPVENVEIGVIKEDNSIIWTNVSAIPLSFPDWNVLAVISDITKRKHAEEVLRENERTYREFFDNPLNGFALCEIITDNKGKPTDFVYLEVNKAFENFTGLKREEVLNKKVTEVLPYDEVAGAIQIYGKVALTGESTVFQYHIPSLDKYYEIAAFAPRKKQFIAFFTDITERKKAEETLGGERELLQAIIDTIPVMITIYDPFELKFQVNKELERVTGWTNEDAQTIDLMAAVYPNPEYREIVTEYVRSLAPGFKDLKMVTKDGKIIDTSWANVRIPDGRQVGIGLDIRERKKAENQIKKRNALLDGINNVFQESLISETEEEVAGKCLEVAEELTSSEFGFLGEIDPAGHPDVLALSPSAWKAFKIPPENIHKMLTNIEMVSYWGRTIKEEKSQIVNNPESDPYKRGLHEEHPKIISFLGVPLKQGSKTIGMIGLANKKDGYTEEDAESIETLSVAFVEALMRKKAEIKLRNTLNNLENKVQERTNELEHAYESLKESEEKFRLIFDEAEDSIVLNEITENGLPGKIIEANEATSKRLGYTKEELLNMTPKEVVAPESRAEMPKNAEKLRREGHALFEILHMTKDGRRIPVEVDNHLIEYRGKNTSLTVVRDITERKKIDKEIKQKNKVLDGINTIFRATITNIDEEEFGKTCLAICEELTGSEFSFIGGINEKGRFDSIAVSERGWQVCEMVKEQGAESVNDNVIRGIRSRAIKEKKILIFNDPTNSPYWSGLPEGHYPITSFLGAPLIYHDKIIGLIALANKKSGYSKEDIEVMEVITTSITESLMHYRALKQLEENRNELKEIVGELERSNKELQSFAYITSHDLQEPLRTMGNYAGLLKRRYEGQLDSDADDFLSFMESGAARMQDMITGLLDYSRVGTKGKEFEEFLAEDALDMALINLQSSIEEYHAEVTHDSLPLIHADKDQISRIFQNLIGNALKFCREGIQPKIHISAKKEEEEYVFSVADNGIGIEEQYTDRIFELFKRLHAIGEYQGTGIGLAIVKRIVDRHGGHIWVKSEYGKGSTFYFTIPFGK